MSDRYFNHVTLLGNIGCEPELSFHRQEGYDQTICNFTLYVKGDPYQVSVWGKLGESVYQWKHKGDLLMVSGNIRLRTYISNGNEKMEVQVNAKEVVFL